MFSTELKLRIKWRNKIVKIDPNKDQIFKHRHGHAFLKRSRVPDKKKKLAGRPRKLSALQERLLLRQIDSLREEDGN